MSKVDILNDLRASHGQTTRAPVPQPASPSCRADFKSHPAYRQLQVGLAAAEAFQTTSPFFRAIEAIDGTRVKIRGQWVVNFASYDYLSLNGSAALIERVCQTVRDFGVSARASRLVGGTYPYHAELETRLAQFLGQEAALTFVSGHGTNQSVLRTLIGPGDLIAVDALAHNSIYEGIRLSGAAHVSFPHNDYAWLDRHLDTCRGQFNRVLIVVEGLYSMDGDCPDLAGFVQIKRRHDAWLMVDEAHSFGVLGAIGRGIAEEQGVAATGIDVQMGTLSKTLCSAGGFIAGSQVLIDILKYAAPGFVYSVGLSAPNAAAALAALDALEGGRAPCQHLRDLGQVFLTTARAAGLDCGANQGFAIAPVIVGDSLVATRLSWDLLRQGWNVLPIITPAVPEKSARLRFFLNAAHSVDDVRGVIAATAAALQRLRGTSAA